MAVATKFAALPWRFGRGSVLSALKKSLDRLGLSSVELYQLHWLVLLHALSADTCMFFSVKCKFLFTFPLSFARPGIWGNEGTRCSIAIVEVKSDNQ